jgi:aminoglycoside 2'-N-acetyltransferase I
VLTTRIVPTAAAAPALREALRRLLDDAFDGDFSHDDWEHALGGWHAIVSEGERLLSHAAVVPRTLEIDGRPLNSGYVEGVATAPDRRGEGLGSLAMSELMDELRPRFALGALSTDRQRFYQRLGWERWQGPTFVRDGVALRRTPEEDDGIMVLRFGSHCDLDLYAAITCEARTGDDW